LGPDSRLFNTILKFLLRLQVIVSKLRSEKVNILSEKALQSGEEVKPRVKSRECKKKQEERVEQ